jgi:uncharacterized repeat protein (TIGR01451 family)
MSKHEPAAHLVPRIRSTLPSLGAFVLSLLMIAPWPSELAAQTPLVPARPPSTAPLLFVQFAEPAGMSVTFYQGRARPRKLLTPCTVGLRPGYVYRVKLTDIPDYPTGVLFPTLDVRGSLCMPPQVSAAKHPAPFVLSARDLQDVTGNNVLTKIIYLEDPETAVPVQSRPGEPVAETEVPLGRDLLQESRQYGRPLFGWRLGNLLVDDAELQEQSIQGTILFPGDNFLPQAAIRPYVPFACVPYFDPILGPAHPREETIADGGDTGMRAGIDREGKLRGLDPSDTVAEFSDSHGRRQVAVSNRVCLCAPRFASLRNEMGLERTQGTIVPGDMQRTEGHVTLQSQVPSLIARQAEAMVGVQGRERASANVGQEALVNTASRTVLQGIELDVGAFALLDNRSLVQLTNEQKLLIARQMELARSLSSKEGTQGLRQSEGTSVVGQIERLAGGSQVVSTRDLTFTCEDMVPTLPDKPLVLRKWVKEHDARVGDVVTFFLRYSNAGGQPISDIAVSDSLTGRLEYVVGTAKTDRPAVFTTQQNEAGSVILRWEIQGRLPAGENGTVSFQARVR